MLSFFRAARRPAIAELREDDEATAAPRPTFEEVFASTAPYAWRALRGLGVHDADVDDACQEVFVVVHRRLASFHEGSSIRTWVYAICLRVASDYRRRPHRARERSIEDAPEASTGPAQEEDLERRRALTWLDGVLDTLDGAKRATFVLFEIEQVPMKEIAAAMSCPLPTAYARLQAARQHVEAAARRQGAREGDR